MREKAEEGMFIIHANKKIDILRADIALEPVTYALASRTMLLVRLCC